jgi:RNase H-fold protein (predicted Holliday junction resolvase)
MNPEGVRMMYLGFDPGKDKCGVAIVDDQGKAQYHEVIPTVAVVEQLKMLAAQWSVTQVVIGDGTTSRQWQAQLQTELPQLSIAPVDEHHSTLEARDLYWEIYPVQGFQKIIPQGMRLPPRPIDDLVAILLVRRYLKLTPR